MYSGYLDYDNGSGYIHVQLMRLVSNCPKPMLTVNLTSNTKKYGAWTLDASATVSDDGAYTSAARSPRQQGIVGDPVILKFFITKQSDAELEIEGMWSELGNDYRFSGILERVSYNIPG